MTINVEHVTRQELEASLEAVLKGVGLSLEELTHLARRHELSPDEVAAWDEIRRIQFLLGE